MNTKLLQTKARIQQNITKLESLLSKCDEKSVCKNMLVSMIMLAENDLYTIEKKIS